MRILGKTNIVVNEVGLGGIPIQRVDQNVANKLIDQMEKEKMNFIDTARGYTVSEEMLGLALEGRRHKFVLATKSMSRDYESMKRDIEISLSNLKTNYIDLYQLHNVSIGENYEGALLALQEAKKEGKIKHIGITTHSLEVLEKVVDENKFETIQFPYNIVETQGEKVFEKAKRTNIGVIVMKPLAGGAIENAKIAMKFILNNENISVVIPGMESIDQIIENNRIINEELTVQEKKEINEVRKKYTNNFCRRCGYCMPCAIGINIPLVFLCDGYYQRYNLKEWALTRYNSMKVKASSCINCGECIKKCPYGLNIPEKLAAVAKLMEGEL